VNSVQDPAGGAADAKFPAAVNLLLTPHRTRGKRQPAIAANSRRGRAVSKPEWGTKRLCQSCGTKFYDLRRPQITCPSCGAEVDRENPLRSRRTRGSAPKPVPEEPVKAPVRIEVEGEGEEIEELEDTDLGDADLDEDLGDEADDDLIEDTSELGDDDMSDVVAATDDKDDER